MKYGYNKMILIHGPQQFVIISVHVFRLSYLIECNEIWNLSLSPFINYFPASGILWTVGDLSKSFGSRSDHFNIGPHL